MNENTYLVWDVKADDAIVKIIACTETDAMEKANRLLPDREYTILAVMEYWLPSVQASFTAKALKEVLSDNDN